MAFATTSVTVSSRCSVSSMGDCAGSSWLDGSNDISTVGVTEGSTPVRNIYGRTSSETLVPSGPSSVPPSVMRAFGVPPFAEEHAVIAATTSTTPTDPMTSRMNRAHSSVHSTYRRSRFLFKRDRWELLPYERPRRSCRARVRRRSQRRRRRRHRFNRHRRGKRRKRQQVRLLLAVPAPHVQRGSHRARVVVVPAQIADRAPHLIVCVHEQRERPGPQVRARGYRQRLLL